MRPSSPPARLTIASGTHARQRAPRTRQRARRSSRGKRRRRATVPASLGTGVIGFEAACSAEELRMIGTSNGGLLRRPGDAGDLRAPRRDGVGGGEGRVAVNSRQPSACGGAGQRTAGPSWPMVGLTGSRPTTPRVRRWETATARESGARPGGSPPAKALSRSARRAPLPRASRRAPSSTGGRGCRRSRPGPRPTRTRESSRWSWLVLQPRPVVVGDLEEPADLVRLRHTVAVGLDIDDLGEACARGAMVMPATGHAAVYVVRPARPRRPAREAVDRRQTSARKSAAAQPVP